MATTTCCLSSSSSSSIFPAEKPKPSSLKRSVFFTTASFNFQHPKLSISSSSARLRTLLAVVDEAVAADIARDNEDSDEETKKTPKPCELYVCNMPRSYDIPDLLDMFSPYGQVISVEVSRNPETGVSKGSGYVTMGSIASARNAIAGLDGSDVDGRELRVRYSVDMISNAEGRNPEALNSSPKRIFIYESPHKLYVGNLPWATKPEELRNLFTRFGTVVSVRVLHDRRNGKNRVFGFLSFSSDAECEAAFSLNGTELNGRRLVVRKGVDRTEL